MSINELYAALVEAKNSLVNSTNDIDRTNALCAIQAITTSIAYRLELELNNRRVA